MNKLEKEKSLYLQQHANNPVDWLPWGDEAFEISRSSNKPILLSIGYSACHWCHVMAHESFEDDDIAEIMNKNFDDELAWEIVSFAVTDFDYDYGFDVNECERMELLCPEQTVSPEEYSKFK